MLTFGKKMLDFPSNSDSFMRLAGRNMQSGEYDNVIELCYRARAACPDDSQLVMIAQALSESGNYDRSMRFIFENFPDPEKRPVEALRVMRDNYRCMHEYMHERMLLFKIYRLTGEVDEPVGNAELVEALSDEDMVLSDFLAYGSDLSSLDENAAENKHLMLACAALRSIQSFLDFDTDAIKRNFESCLGAIDVEDGPTMPEHFLIDHHAFYIFSCIFSGTVEDALNLIDKLQKANIGSTHVYATACAYSLLLCLTSPNKDFTDDTGSTNTTDFIDTLCVARALLILGEYEKAYPYAKRVLKAKPYSIGANNLFAACAFGKGDYKSAYVCYARLSKMLPDDIAARYYKNMCLAAKNGDESAANAKIPIAYTIDLGTAKSYTDDMRALLEKTPEELDEALNTNATAKGELTEFMYLLEDEFQLKAMKLLCACKSDTAAEIRRRLLLDKEVCIAAKEMAVRAFLAEDTQRAVAIACTNAFFEAVPSLLPSGSIKKVLYGAYKRCYKNVLKAHGIVCAVAINELFSYTSLFDIDSEAQAEAMAPHLHTMAARMCGFDDDLETVTQTYYPEIDIVDAEDAVADFFDIEEDFINDLYGNL